MVAVSEHSLARGRTLFAENCALCHGESGDGHGVRRTGLTATPADFTSPLWRARNDMQSVRRTITQGERGTSMPAFRGLGDDDVHALAAYVLSLAPRSSAEAGRAR